ncbi:Prolyl 4-hydroxylase alpha subunit [Operophtera brumata]|uniref:Prolyl 4-hydroxylase alpha subunit n=1 Tax=Operophtera brumata TaxID=104452 RepID=A0A0L7KQN0_OPEBR|nr:Prolyl 4-hydroxylase alpha subunit [Operophtera brumata]
MTTDECYKLGKALYNERDFTNALAWMSEALRKYRETNDESYEFTEVDILEYIGFAHYLLDGNWKWNFKQERKVYEALCRGEMEISAEISKQLKCWYSTEKHAFLKYAPIKTEQMYIKPDVFIFHEVMSDSEIELIKSIAAPRFKRATIIDSVSRKSIPANFRISKSSWLKDEESPQIARISQRVTDMTGLSMISAEELQVVNYGIGGYYKPHYDFTRLGLSLFPVKGAAAFWMNLHPSGEGDIATRHGACPVLRGSKWVSTKWMHIGGQEFLRPCALEYQAEGIARALPRPVPCPAL